MLSLFQQKIVFNPIPESEEKTNARLPTASVGKTTRAIFYLFIAFVIRAFVWLRTGLSGASTNDKENCCLNEDSTKRWTSALAQHRMLHFPTTHLISDPSSSINCAPPSSSMSNKRAQQLIWIGTVRCETLHCQLFTHHYERENLFTTQIVGSTRRNVENINRCAQQSIASYRLW